MRIYSEVGEFMNRKRFVIGFAVIVMIAIIFGNSIEWTEHVNVSENEGQTPGPAASPDVIKKDLEIRSRSPYENEEAYIQLDHLDAIFYPGMDSFDVMVSSCAAFVEYCEISADFGKVSSDCIKVKKENRFTYYVPSGFENLRYDMIGLKFYDENRKFISEMKIAVDYDKDQGWIQIVDMNVLPRTEVDERI